MMTRPLPHLKWKQLRQVSDELEQIHKRPGAYAPGRLHFRVIQSPTQVALTSPAKT